MSLLVMKSRSPTRSSRSATRRMVEAERLANDNDDRTRWSFESLVEDSTNANPQLTEASIATDFESTSRPFITEPGFPKCQ